MKVCVHCGYTWEEVLKKKSVGCVECYSTFSEEIKKIKSQLITRTDLMGLNISTPVQKTSSPSTEPNLQPINELISLKEQLSKFIHQENFEDAAKVRDEIAKLKENGTD